MKTASSLWREIKCRKYAPLQKAAAFDVAVIGGGITGLTAAYLLKQAGKRVCLLEKEHLGIADTGSTTAHLTYVTDLRIAKLARIFGNAGAHLVLRAGAVAMGTIEEIAREQKIDCDFRRVPGFLHASLTGKQDETKELNRDYRSARGLGLPAQFLKAVPSIGKPGVLFPNQAKFHPLKYLAGLARQVHGDGSAVFEQTEVTDIEGEKTLHVTANGKRITCRYVVIATHVPLMGKTGALKAALFQTKQYPYSSYVIGAKAPKGTFPEASYWDTSDPYYYLRVDAHRDHDYLIFGGEDHKTGQKVKTQDCYKRLERLLKQLAPAAKVDHHWSGQVIETNDGLPFIGEIAERQFVATGFSGNGMTFGTLAGLMARDTVLGRTNPWQELLAVNRKKVRGGSWDYLVENLDYPYYYVKDRLAGTDGTSVRAVKRGQGKILRLDGNPVACSRDDDGKLHVLSPYCTHMGCYVHWNQGEQTWDCPCHGSRFNPTGKVMAGPAETPLEPIPQPAKSAKG